MAGSTKIRWVQLAADGGLVSVIKGQRTARGGFLAESEPPELDRKHHWAQSRDLRPAALARERVRILGFVVSDRRAPQHLPSPGTRGSRPEPAPTTERCA
ncbi:unnamed protein product [Rangifer tarandus platyrhynchus]|uniref:Uncharacterized protein n=1 Tax=Rangifer tarandus platyrhynchus TaxID=3082113 RepID=A0AC60A134_RANTA